MPSANPGEADIGAGRLLIIDDERAFAEFVERVAVQLGFETRVATGAADFLETIDEWQPTVLAVDLQMPDVDGIQLLRTLAERRVTSRILLASGVDPRTLAAAGRLAADQGLAIAGIVQKPIRAADLRRLLASLAVPDEPSGVISRERLSAAIDNDELGVAYQPIVDIRTRAMVGVEALARWMLPSGLPVPPDKFIATAESSGLIARLTDRILDKVIAQASAWCRAGVKLPVAVNLSVACLDDLRFPDKLASRCAAAGLPTGQLRLELTETATMQNAIRMMDVLTRVRLKGFELSLDDFGTGYSSLRMLHRLPVTMIKIDRSFVVDMASDRSSSIITKTIVEMAHNLDLSVVAEGIEDEATLRLLDQFGCDLGQGYLFSPAVAADKITALAATGPLRLAAPPAQPDDKQ